MKKQWWRIGIGLAVVAGVVAVAAFGYVANAKQKAAIAAQAMETVTIPVRGMHCESCQQKIETALRQVPGVSDIQIDLAAETVRMTYDKNKIVLPALVETIQKQGFTPEVPSENLLQVIDVQVKFN